MPFLRRILLYFDVFRRLGFRNVAYVAWYRFSLKSGLRKHFFPIRSFTEAGPFFHSVDAVRDFPDVWNDSLIQDAERIVQGYLRFYARHWQDVGAPPNWFLNPFNGKVWSNQKSHWTVFPDFHPDLGDIKHVWEASRFEWVVTLARAYAVSGNAIYIDTLNQWLGDWAKHNPVNSGLNWKCGQEAAIRVFNLLLAALILKQWLKPSPALYEFVYRHLERISANIRYAIAQDNNHGISEAAALFIGGCWLAKIDSCSLTKLDTRLRGNDRLGNVNARKSGNGISNIKRQRKVCGRFVHRGRKWLENRVEKLVEVDGSFSQHSVTYHRVLLDTLIYVEFWRRQFDVAGFSNLFYRRAQAALDWLHAMTDPHSGNAPNLGSNDGAMLLHAHSCNYRDFRPGIQTASSLFRGRRLFADGPWDEPGYWLGIKENSTSVDLPTHISAKVSRVLSGGYVIMSGKGSWGMLRFPMYRFRPGHNDVFHFDLWWWGLNICRDDGSYSYHPENIADEAYFGSVKAHNTVCFDDDEQMPRLGRFLLGKWIAAEQIGAIEQRQDGWQSWRGVYRDWKGHTHKRMISWKDHEWIVEDSITGNFENAEIRFRLAPDQYKLGQDSVSSSWGRIELSGTNFYIDLEKGFESLYYQEKQHVETLVIRPVRGYNVIKTRFILGL
ncbi:MAG: heparinase II/III family protein [Candidatus Vecturithrix sp.]|jgi:hypothetical protein|nr:heparinase II/III family protein [Candidatus Vecturithrix sp.]